MRHVWFRCLATVGMGLGLWGAVTAPAEAAWCGKSFAYIGPSVTNATWYTCSDVYLQPSGRFHNATLGTVRTLPLGGEVQVWRGSGSSTAEMGYTISGPVNVTNEQFITMVDVGDCGDNNNNDKYQVTTPVDLIATHSLTAGAYTLSVWFHSNVTGDSSGANGEAWDSNNSSNFVATFTVESSTTPEIVVTGETTKTGSGIDPVDFSLSFSILNAEAASWSWAVMDGETEMSSGTTNSCTFSTSALGTWQLNIHALDSLGADITNKSVSLTVQEDVSNLGTIWHCPTNREPWTDVAMRIPEMPHAGDVVWVRVGNWKGADGSVIASTAIAYYRFGTSGEWSSMAMTEETDQTYKTENQYWRASIPSDETAAGKTLQYYFEVKDYAGNSKPPTFAGGMMNDPNGYALHSTAAAAQALPFTASFAASGGTEPAWIWHGGNLTRVSDSSVQIWVKIGYINGATRWADEAEIRYVITDDARLAGRRSGVKAIRRPPGAKASTLVNPTIVSMNYDHSEADDSPDGDAMWWVGTIDDPALASPTAVLKYEIYARKTTEAGGTGTWRQAEYTSASTTGDTFEYRMWSDGSGKLQINASSKDYAVSDLIADYTTSKWFIDESDPKDIVTFHITFAVPADADAVELFTNLGRRDYADVDMDGDGWPDGMIPPSGDSVTPENSVNGYWQALPMSLGSGAWERTVVVSNCGVYRITARYKAKGSNTWSWYSDLGTAKQRDHAVVISPRKAMKQTMYELNVLTTKATGTANTDAGNFEELSERLGSGGDFDEFSLAYLNKLGVNCLWFQPIHPNLEYSRGNTDSSGNRYYPGSPYATKNYFSVNYEMSREKNEAKAVAAFTNYVRLCDKARSDVDSSSELETINVMLDGVMNHTSWDAIFGEGLARATNGLGEAALAELDSAYSGWRNLSATDCIPASGLGINWYSRQSTPDGSFKQSQPATYYHGVEDNDIAAAPERFDFGKWNDVAELLYGDYSTMVRYDDRQPPNYALTEETSRIYSEEDMYYYGDMLPATKLLWKYMATYPEFWLEKTGNALVNQPGQRDANGVLLDDYGIDGLRCDYAQGLPNQFWEYVINRTRSKKWNFLFMAESLDGGKVGYRSNRQFDILNENMVFRFTQDKVSEPGPFQAALEDRRAAYGNGIILLNLTCHDEPIPFGDPQATASRYAMVNAIDGIPMIYYGQEHAISRYDSDFTPNKWKGFYLFEENFGKWIPHFKSWNKMYVWDEPAYAAGTPNDSRAIAQFYGRINHARLASPALQSKNRWFLNDNNRISFVAKWETAGANPNVQDSVFAATLFVNEGDGGHTGAAHNYSIQDFAGLMGIENRADRFYNVRNLAASNPNALLWETPKSGSDLYANGLYVGFNGTSDGTTDAPASQWTDNGAVVQYLKVVDVTEYAAPVFHIGDIPANITPNTPVSVSVSATGDGAPVVSITNVTPGDTTYTYGDGALAFTPPATGTYAFAFLAQNTRNAASAVTNLTIIVGATPPPGPDAPIHIDAITNTAIVIRPGGEDFILNASCTNLPAGITSIPVWTADTITNGDWNWAHTTNATVEGTSIFLSLPLENQQIISIGKPEYLP